MKLWYESCAKEWTEALPLGNGHMGAMAYGGALGLFELFENTCWSGSPDEKCLVDNAKEYMRQARALLTEKRIEEAETLLKKCAGIKGNYGTQVPMGRLYVGVSEEPHNTSRELDLESGTALDMLFFDNCKVRRESFISNPDKIMCVKLTTEGEKRPQLRVWLEGWSQPSFTHYQGNDLVVKGRALENKHSDGLHGVAYIIQLRVVTDGRISWSRNSLQIEDAKDLTVYMTAATDMFENDLDTRCQKKLDSAESSGWFQLKEAHCEEHASWMNKCKLTLAPNHASGLPTDQRIAAFRKDQTDYDLVSLFFQYGRYLLMNSSRPDSLLPAALQGVWNDNRACRMVWTDDMHLDINTQMNYYPAEVTGLMECITPLFAWIKNKLAPNGQTIAKELYDCEGWVAHTVSNAYGWAAPGWEFSDFSALYWGFNITGGAWVASHIWNHYLYTKDVDFLKDYYEVLYGAGKFLCAVLTEDSETGELVTNPSYSPENIFVFEGKEHTMSTGATVDTIVNKYIFGAVIKAAEILDCKDDFTAELEETLQKLPEFKVGVHGQLLEWHSDFEEAIPDHRHTSHLLAMHPFNLINPDQTPELKAAIKTSLSRRLGENAMDIVQANWAGALLILHHARLLEGEAAGEFVKPMMSYLSRSNMMITHEGPTTSITGGIYELDGNTGFTAGIAEMLLQSYSGEIHLLPAIPSAWAEGEFKGLVAYDGHIIDVHWDMKAIHSNIHANMDGKITVRYGDIRKEIEVRKGLSYKVIFR